MKSFIKENAALVIALTLPIIFAAFFYIFKDHKNTNIAPPKYDFVIYDENGRDSFDFNIINDKLQATFTYQTVHGNGRPYNVNQPNLYYVDADTMIAEPISVNMPADASNPAEDIQGTRLNIDMPKFEELRFNAAAISPDGFEMTYKHEYRDANIMTEIFSGHRNNDNGLVLAKDGGSFEIRGLDRHYGYKVIGWVISE